MLPVLPWEIQYTTYKLIIACPALATWCMQWLKRHPVNREPPFQPGTAGLRLSWQKVQEPRSIFRLALAQALTIH